MRPHRSFFVIKETSVPNAGGSEIIVAFLLISQVTNLLGNKK